MNKVTRLHTEPTIAAKAFIAVSKSTMFRTGPDFSNTNEGAKHCDAIQLKTQFTGS
jgi:hypothetical protein